MQRKLDGKLLESQLGEVESEVVAEGTEEGLDWDSFSRDKGWAPQTQQWGQGQYGGGEYGYEYDYAPRETGRYGVYVGVEKQIRATGVSSMGVVQAVRAPRGPDADGGKGFKGRGGARSVVGAMRAMRLEKGGVREFVPGGNAWGA